MDRSINLTPSFHPFICYPAEILTDPHGLRRTAGYIRLLPTKTYGVLLLSPSEEVPSNARRFNGLCRAIPRSSFSKELQRSPDPTTAPWYTGARLTPGPGQVDYKARANDPRSIPLSAPFSTTSEKTYLLYRGLRPATPRQQ